MSDIVEGLGTAVEGGLFSRVLDPESGAKERHEGDPENCLNCGTRLEGAYCHACGQSGHVHRTIGAFMHDLVHGALHFEGKMWRTLPMLAFKPGALTRRYIEGERARFVSPMALFLFSVFLMFAVFQMVGLTTPTDVGGPNVDEVIDQVDAQTVSERDSVREALEAMAPDDPERATTQQRLDELEVTLDRIENVQALNLSENSGIHTGVDWLDNTLVKKWSENPGLMLYKLQANAYKFSWLLIPISIPFVWLLFFWRRRFKAYDHAIFVTYSLSFMTLLFVAASVLSASGMSRTAVFTTIATLAPLHLYKHLRHSYELSRFSALWRFLALSSFIWIVIALFVQALLLIGAF
ncbi:DUF3667 domain-containing protein [Alteraurantiacibacter aquimixticola]|uniref:DUF3667 domain-containing protein n=1 Tax=Alteraurantiacibacter aquimixticola TaxID=2489173 RepID=A0A4T3F5V4_9SPHN|nr:DUF3667 domain-containing protein [Alteraurantiacibacter aquimixticola]TIX51012.1 DUF3667 domain-containing protein [Alteraurantiacibacter aquimixticola]